MAKLCLNMVVGAETGGLDRCLASLAGVVDAWVIADIGAPPSARDLIARMLEGIPGRIVDVPFRSFAQVRNQALAACRKSDLAFDHILLLDQDMQVVVPDPGFRDRLAGAAFAVTHIRDRVTFRALRIVARGAGGHYRGVTREFFEIAAPIVNLDGLAVLQSVDAVDPRERAALDARLLVEGLRTEQDPMMRARYTFYLGNVLFALGDLAGARRRHLERANMGFWEEEAYCARLYAARAGRALGVPAVDLLQELAAITNDMPHRGETLYEVARLCRENGWWEAAYEAANAATELDRPTDALFSEDWVYDYGIADELAVAAYWTGRHAECQQICEALLGGVALPANDRERIAANRDLAASAAKVRA